MQVELISTELRLRQNNAGWKQTNNTALNLFPDRFVLCLGQANGVGSEFEASLGSKNGVPAHHYTFKVLECKVNSGKFSDIMVKGCSELGSSWKPLCEHPSYCRK